MSAYKVKVVKLNGGKFGNVLVDKKGRRVPLNIKLGKLPKGFISKEREALLENAVQTVLSNTYHEQMSDAA